MIDQDHGRFAKTMDVNLWAPLLWTRFAVIAFLASDAASWITGETMVIDGGRRLGNAATYRGGTSPGA